MVVVSHVVQNNMGKYTACRLAPHFTSTAYRLAGNLGQIWDRHPLPSKAFLQVSISYRQECIKQCLTLYLLNWKLSKHLNSKTLRWNYHLLHFEILIQYIIGPQNFVSQHYLIDSRNSGSPSLCWPWSCSCCCCSWHRAWWRLRQSGQMSWIHQTLWLIWFIKPHDSWMVLSRFLDQTFSSANTFDLIEEWPIGIFTHSFL